VVAHTCHSSTQEVKTVDFQVQGIPQLHRKFQARLDYIMRPCFTEQNKKKLMGKEEMNRHRTECFQADF
jgi:hypothetical protein